MRCPKNKVKRIEVALRPAVLGDCEALTNLCLRAKAVWGYSEAFLGLTREDMAVTPRRLNEEIVWVAEQSQTLLGVVALGAYPNELETGEVTMVFVHPDVHGQGLGMLLIECIIEKARAKGYRRLIVVSDPNALGFYESADFQQAGLSSSEYIPDRLLPRLVREI